MTTSPTTAQPLHPTTSRSRLLMEELRQLHRTQQVRISASGAVLIATSPDANVGSVPHAVGKRKPSLDEMDSQVGRFRRRG